MKRHVSPIVSVIVVLAVVVIVAVVWTHVQGPSRQLPNRGDISTTPGKITQKMINDAQKARIEWYENARKDNGMSARPAEAN